MLVRLERHPNGLRVWICGHRWHHYSSGAALVAIGAWLIWGDRADLRPQEGAMLFDPEVGITTSHNRGMW